ncbi:molybdopterin adenylyltransferase [Tardiphaga alba]|uniref:Molybdopterin adenylyltransferase n=1 Tax=Tardiphaga alba TaxID=340268 RepID=A0ABX8ABQ7_9BRAD|nr:molybdopterin adenylyltransferase [Tardiphaga alba]QUS40084.1 molybdopterin adenylyltransferase [Tardiphaga alba]
MRIAIITISDRAARGDYEDISGPAIEACLRGFVTSDFELVRRVVADGRALVADALMEYCDRDPVDLILTTGGTGPAPRDETPEAMQSVMEKELAGFGELMRRVSLEQTPTAILSRQTAGIRGQTLIINLPGRPAAIDICLRAVFPAVPYCLDLIGAGRIETDPAVLASFRPA